MTSALTLAWPGSRPDALRGGVDLDLRDHRGHCAGSSGFKARSTLALEVKSAFEASFMLFEAKRYPRDPSGAALEKLITSPRVSTNSDVCCTIAGGQGGWLTPVLLRKGETRRLLSFKHVEVKD